MKKILKFLILILIIGCKTNTSDKNIDFNEFIEKNDNYDHIIGPVNRKELEKYPFSMWFDKSYKDYLIDSETTSLIGKLINDFEITVFMGTWCEESQKDLPAFFKIIDQTSFDKQKIKMIAMTEDKTTPGNLEKGLEIYNIPTFIFKKNGTEINRIVEFPVETLEKDMYKILSGQDYKNIYADF